MFRKLYWVTEHVDPFGTSHIAGVYTSIPDLIRNGLTETHDGSKLRLTLTKLDSDKTPFGTWCEPEFDGLMERLRDFVATEEFSDEHCHMLVEALQKRSAVTA
jgi:hypothetical protein